MSEQSAPKAVTVKSIRQKIAADLDKEYASIERLEVRRVKLGREVTETWARISKLHGQEEKTDYELVRA